MKSMLVSLCAVSMIAGSTFAQELVVNGGFETGDFTGWTQFGDTGSTGVDNTDDFFGIPAPQGVMAGYFGPSNAAGGIRQVLTANAGEQMTLTFQLALLDTENNGFSVVLDGVLLMSIVNGMEQPFTSYSFTVTLANSNPTLSFAFYNPPSYHLLDAVSATVPTPGAAAALSLAGMTAFRRRRR